MKPTGGGASLPSVAEVKEALTMAPYTNTEMFSTAKENAARVADVLARLPDDAVLVTRDSLWAVLEGMGVIANGTWVSYQPEDADRILAAIRAQP
jgi:hypothetical protein